MSARRERSQGQGQGSPAQNSEVNGMNLSELKEKSISDLNVIARDLNVQNMGGLRKQELIFKILQSQAEKDGLIFAEGVLEVLPETGAEDAAWENARIRAEMLRTQLLKGSDFSELAKQYSRDASARDGGDLGTLKRGELAQDIETQILNLSPGQVSTPYRSTLGYHIFKLESKETLEGENLARVRAQIREILFREKFDTRLDAWLKGSKQRGVMDVRLDGQL